MLFSRPLKRELIAATIKLSSV